MNNAEFMYESVSGQYTKLNDPEPFAELHRKTSNSWIIPSKRIIRQLRPDACLLVFKLHQEFIILTIVEKSRPLYYKHLWDVGVRTQTPEQTIPSQ